MARLRYNGLRSTLGASLTSSATSVTFAAALTHSNGTNVPTISGSDYIPLAILDSSGHESEIVWLTAYTAAATTGTIARGKEGTSGVAHNSGDVIGCATLAADVTDVGLIACTAYNPSTLTTYSTASTTLSDLDATNLSVTFTAPTSGSVLVRLTALCDLSTATASAQYWALREGSSGVSGTLSQVRNATGGLTTVSVTVRVNGLTPGSSHTYKWAWKSNSTSVTCHVYAGGTQDPSAAGADSAGTAVMEVTALP